MNTCKQSCTQVGLPLQGTVPKQLGALTHLQNLNLSSNQLTGSLPASIGQLQLASGLWLDHNQLTGSVPEAWCHASVTSAVHVDSNPGLYREVPQCLQGRLLQGSGYAGTGLIQGDGLGSSEASSSSSSIASDGSSGGSISSSSSGGEAPICSSISCGSVCWLYA